VSQYYTVHLGSHAKALPCIGRNSPFSAIVLPLPPRHFLQATPALHSLRITQPSWVLSALRNIFFIGELFTVSVFLNFGIKDLVGADDVAFVLQNKGAHMSWAFKEEGWDSVASFPVLAWSLIQIKTLS